MRKRAEEIGTHEIVRVLKSPARLDGYSSLSGVMGSSRMRFPVA